MSDQDRKHGTLNDQDFKLARMSFSKINALGEVLRRVIPDASDDLIGTVAHDLGDFLEIAENHRVRVEEILKLRGAEDQRKLAELLEDLYYGDVKHHLSYHVESMDEILPALIEKLEGETEK